MHPAEVKVLCVFGCSIAATGLIGAGHVLGVDAMLLDTAKARYYEAVDGQSDALEQARELLAKLRSDHPDNPLILAYAGSTRLLESSKTLAVWRKGKLAQQGLAELDEAVARAPEDPEVRFVRAASTFHLPGLFRRGEQSKADFAWLAPRVLSAIDSGSLPPRLGAAALYHHGLFRERSGDLVGARSAWQSAVRVGGNTLVVKEAKKRLEQP